MRSQWAPGPPLGVIKSSVRTMAELMFGSLPLLGAFESIFSRFAHILGAYWAVFAVLPWVHWMANPGLPWVVARECEQLAELMFEVLAHSWVHWCRTILPYSLGYIRWQSRASPGYSSSDQRCYQSFCRRILMLLCWARP